MECYIFKVVFVQIADTRKRFAPLMTFYPQNAET